jgi:hypothetical protein
MPWTGYNPSNWTDASGTILGEPAKNKSFDNNCAGCHFTGVKLPRDSAGYFHASATLSRHLSDGAILGNNKSQPQSDRVRNRFR